MLPHVYLKAGHNCPEAWKTLSERPSAVMSVKWLALVLAADELVDEWEVER